MSTLIRKQPFDSAYRHTMLNLTQKAKEIRRDVLSLIHKGQTSHVASCFSLTDIAVTLYENLEEEDEVIWSKGWASALFYIIGIHYKGLNREEVFNTFPNHPYPALLEPPLVPIATGSVGHGLSFAVGVAYAKKLKGEKGTVYCLMSDGELNEGSVWEAVMFASHHKLDNLVAIVDKNGWQAMGRAEEVLNIDIHGAFNGFGWASGIIDGHDYLDIKLGIQYQSKLPRVIVARTTKGKGVSFFTDHLLYHYKHVSLEVYEAAMRELNGEILPEDTVQKLRKGI